MIKYLFLSLAIFLFFGICYAQDQQNKTTLVIGNSNYSDFLLKKPEKDADALAQSLQSIGFMVMKENNLSRDSFQNHLKKFKEALLKNKGIGLFFFTGYGMHVKGENYLVPSSVSIKNEEEFESKAISLKSTIREIESAQNDLNIIILDIYPDCPIRKQLDTTIQYGVKVELSSRKTILVFSYLPGSVPCNCFVSGLYTREFIAALQIQNVSVSDFLKIVKRNVTKQSRSKQIPWDNSAGQHYILNRNAEK